MCRQGGDGGDPQVVLDMWLFVTSQGHCKNYTLDDLGSAIILAMAFALRKN